MTSCTGTKKLFCLCYTETDMKGGKTKTPRGYTIVEVMIFLAVSGFMFIIAAQFVSGKQAHAEFRQGMNDVKAQVQQTINDVANGYFPSNSDFSCNTESGRPQPDTGSTGQGQNKGCVFM